MQMDAARCCRMRPGSFTPSPIFSGNTHQANIQFGFRAVPCPSRQRRDKTSREDKPSRCHPKMGMDRRAALFESNKKKTEQKNIHKKTVDNDENIPLYHCGDS